MENKEGTFNLSEKMYFEPLKFDYFKLKDVREFIKRLKEEEIFMDRNDAKRFDAFINKLAGGHLAK